jgi:hypothetical protein
MAGLGDFLAGVGGAPVNRPGLEAFVANSQAMNGLRTAQTEEALLNAQNIRDELDAKGRVEQALGDFLGTQNDPHAKEHASLISNVMRAKFGSFKDSEAGLGDALKNINTQTLMNPNAAPAARTAADQANNPNANPYQVDQGQLIPRFQADPNHPTVIQTPGSVATQHSQEETARLHGAQADAGGFNPHTAGVSSLPPEQQAAIQHAVDEGRLNFKDINSRNANIIGSLALNNPTYNFNRAAADAALSRNSTFQQRAMVVDSLPGLISNTASLGKKLNYPDVQVVGQAKKWLLGQTNDPDLTEYMTARNDVLMKIANVMRGVGMSDKAHEAEVEAMNPTLSPAALDAWVKGQMTAIGPLMEAQKRAAHIGEPGVNGSTPQGGTTAAAPPGNDLAALAKAELQRRGIKVP